MIAKRNQKKKSGIAFKPNSPTAQQSVEMVYCIKQISLTNLTRDKVVGNSAEKSGGPIDTQ